MWLAVQMLLVLPGPDRLFPMAQYVLAKDFNAGAFIDVANGVGNGPEPDEGWKLE